MTTYTKEHARGMLAQIKRAKGKREEVIAAAPVSEAVGTQELPIGLIQTNGGTQTRAEINKDVVDEYADQMEMRALFPAVVVFYDGERYWLADGFHRLAAVKRLNWTRIFADVRQGTKRDAVQFSLGANAHHGLRRSNADKRRAVTVMLTDAEWQTWTNVAIAKACGVSEGLVREMRPHFVKNDVSRTYTTRHGTVSTMNTTKIGQREQTTECPFAVGETVRMRNGRDNAIYTVIGINPGGKTVRLRSLARKTDIKTAVLVNYLQHAEAPPTVLGEESPLVSVTTVGYENGFPVSPEARLPEISAPEENAQPVEHNATVIDVTIRSDDDPVIPTVITPVYSVSALTTPNDLMTIDEYMQAIRDALTTKFSDGEIVYVEHTTISGATRDALKVRVVIHA